MEKIPTFVPVVAAMIGDSRGRLLLQQALPGKRHAGEWEFPGGKVDPGETPRAALVREVAEELGLRLSSETLRPTAFADEPAAADRPALVLFLYTCGVWSGTPQALEGQAWGWFTLGEARALPLAALDRILLDLAAP